MPVQDRSPTGSPGSGESLFSAMIFGVVPLLLVYAWLMGRVEARFTTDREALVRTMQSREAVFSRYATPEEFLPRWIGSWARQGLPAFQGFLTLLERRHPGAVRGIAWDGNGRLLPLPGPGLFGRKAWGNMMSRHGLTPRPSSGLAAALVGDPDARLLQGMLGKKIKLDQLLALRNEARRSVWLDRDCFLVQVFPDPRNAPSPGIIGGLFLVFPDALPPEFLSRLGLRAAERLFADGVTRISIFRLAGASARFLSSTWWKRYRSRTDPVLSWGSRLILGIDRPLGSLWKAFLVADTAPLRRKAKGDLALLRTAWFFGGLWILLFAWIRGTAWFTGFGFRWRIAWNFTLSLVAPTALFFFLAAGLVDLETERSRQEAFEKLAAAGSVLQQMYDLHPGLYGKRLEQDLATRIPGDPSPEAFYAGFDRWIQRGIIAGYYVADRDGLLQRVNDPRRGSSGVPFMLTVFRNEIADWKAEGLPEDFSDRVFRIMAWGQLRRVAIGKTQTNMAVLRIRENGESRLLIYEVSVDHLNRSFLKFWSSRAMRKRSGFRRHGDRPDWDFVSPSLKRGRSTRLSLALRHARGFQGWSFPATMQGEAEFDRKPCFFHIPEARPLTPFRTVVSLSQADYRRRLEDRWSQIHRVVGVSLFSAFIYGLFLAGSLLRPVLSLDRAVRELRTGHLSIVLPEVGTNEIGRLNRSFNDMTEGLRQRERMRAFVSASVLQAVTEERPATGRLGEVREVTVLFTHIHRFDDLLRRHSPHEVFGMLNGFLAGAEPCIRRVGGEVDKFLGDALMAVFLRDGKETAAVTAALALHEFISRFNLERRAAGSFPIEIGIGINTGPVMMGDVGSSRRKDLTVIGDTVNVAARLEAVSAQGRKTRIILSEKTYAAVGHLIEAEEMGISQVKGKTERVRIFELVTTRLEGAG